MIPLLLALAQDDRVCDVGVLSLQEAGDPAPKRVFPAFVEAPGR